MVVMKSYIILLKMIEIAVSSENVLLELENLCLDFDERDISPFGTLHNTYTS
jgi:hypothetical protein